MTGGATGIGEAISHKFAHEGADILIAGLANDPIEEVAATIRSQYPSVRVATYSGDLSKYENATACIHKALDAFGKIDSLINNA